MFVYVPRFRCSHLPELFPLKVLAQTLVRREHFPNSGNILREKQRFPMILEELKNDSAVKLICLQEVDRMEKLAPALKDVGFEYIYASGVNKKHGCVIAFQQAEYRPETHKIIYYDDELADGSKHALSFKTRNIGLIVALRGGGAPGGGIILATTHLFWHPCYYYERTRQALILLREVRKLQQELSVDWPCIIAGDFNFDPADPAYALLRGVPLTTAHKQALDTSRVVHHSVDSTVPITYTKGEQEGDEVNPSRQITNARRAEPKELLSDEDFIALATSSGPVRSAYDEGFRSLFNTSLLPEGTVFKDRASMPTATLGAFEPCYTAYAHFWQTTLDYIFIVQDQQTSDQLNVSGLLDVHRSNQLEGGLPKEAVGGSDHVSLCCELSWS
ncbi:Endonuclease/exonuclease/phosphatase [Flagelloscypha sp. PMI_526]|nr:Endonuclease/exonuclease/phosphatase [Flagelloscypha sp. PMI_526]